MNEPLVFIVGAGPGNPGLLTVRAVECLWQADLVLFDHLVPARLLDHCRADAERVCVASLHASSPARCPQVHERMIQAARDGKRVVRLKGGDPFLFGRGGEEALAMRDAGIPFEIVPGVTAGLAAGDFAGIPLTHRGTASAVAFITGHEDPLKSTCPLDWASLARFPGTLVIYMGMSRLAQIVGTLIEHGKAADTPAAVVQWATTGRQRTVTSHLDELPDAVHKAGLKAPSIIVVGPVVALRSQLAWFESRPLLGRRILVTRPRQQAHALVEPLEGLGAVVDLLPVVEIRELTDFGPLDRVLAQLDCYEWLVFTSRNGVEAFLRRLRQTGRDLRSLGKLKLAAIGPGTAEELGRHYLDADLVPAEFRSESLAAALKQEVAGQRVLLARADRGRELLREELARVAEVEEVAVYCQADVTHADEVVRLALGQGAYDYITLTSSNIARGLSRWLDEPAREAIRAHKMKLVSISPVTTSAAGELALPVALEARTYTTEGVVEAIVRAETASAGP
jgi:uroporphyrinogen III methyltransferase/synthase